MKSRFKKKLTFGGMSFTCCLATPLCVCHKNVTDRLSQWVWCLDMLCHLEPTSSYALSMFEMPQHVQRPNPPPIQSVTFSIQWKGQKTLNDPFCVRFFRQCKPGMFKDQLLQNSESIHNIALVFVFPVRLMWTSRYRLGVLIVRLWGEFGVIVTQLEHIIILRVGKLLSKPMDNLT